MEKGLKSFLRIRFNQHLVLLAALTAALSPSLAWGQAAATAGIGQSE